MKILVVDDHQNIIDTVTLCINLRWPTAQIMASYDGENALDILKKETPDIVILDIGLPEMDGFSVLNNMRRFSHIPVIMLTVRDSDIDIARALEMGADDYITKPFSHVEFLARVEAVLRRTTGRANSSQAPLSAGDLWADFERGEVLIGRNPIQLTQTEMSILRHLMYNAGRVVTHGSLVAAIWKTDAGDIDTHTVTVHIRHLRSKLGDSIENPKYIGTVRGTGYRFLKQTTTGVTIDSQPPDSLPTDQLSD